jgi:hypothetical protein
MTPIKPAFRSFWLALLRVIFAGRNRFFSNLAGWPTPANPSIEKSPLYLFDWKDTHESHNNS